MLKMCTRRQCWVLKNWRKKRTTRNAKSCYYKIQQKLSMSFCLCFIFLHRDLHLRNMCSVILLQQWCHFTIFAALYRTKISSPTWLNVAARQKARRLLITNWEPSYSSMLVYMMDQGMHTLASTAKQKLSPTIWKNWLANFSDSSLQCFRLMKPKALLRLYS